MIGLTSFAVFRALAATWTGAGEDNLWSNPANWDGQFEDVEPTAKYVNLTKHGACSTAIYLGERFPKDSRRLAQMRELLRFSEDQFVCWEPPFKNGRFDSKQPVWSASYDAWPSRAKLVYADWINCMIATAQALSQLAEFEE